MGNWKGKKYLEKLVSCFSQIWQIRFKKNISCERLGSEFWPLDPNPETQCILVEKVDSILERTNWFEGSWNLAMNKFIAAGAECELFRRRPRGFEISWMRPQRSERASKCLGGGFEISLGGFKISWRSPWCWSEESPTLTINLLALTSSGNTLIQS